MITNIGSEYSIDNNNCAHFVAKWYKENGISDVIPTDNLFSRRFVVWMRKHFSEIKKPSNHSLVLMVNSDGSYHVGVYYQYMIVHNFKPAKGSGSVCKWTVGAVKAYYKEVRFYKWSQ